MKAKPFIKWVGGKSQLIGQLTSLLPSDFGNIPDLTYIEPFVGGGAMLFQMLQQYPNITRAVINDVNTDLINCYHAVRERPDELINALSRIEKEYHALTSDEQKDYYLAKREIYNRKDLDIISNTVLFFFLNRTCFNGLYRVNAKGLFNVPFGKYANPCICDPDTIIADSRLLQNVELLSGDFEQTFSHCTQHTFFYFDPPYRPLSNTSSFNSYAREAFNDEAQIRLKLYCDKIHAAGHRFMLSNSDGRGANDSDTFFDDLYAAYHIERVWASRSINANPDKRGKLTEILVHNYSL